jgi:hypothetical protein
MLLENLQYRERMPWRNYSVHKRPDGLTVIEVDAKLKIIDFIEEIILIIVQLELLGDRDDDLFILYIILTFLVEDLEPLVNWREGPMPILVPKQIRIVRFTDGECNEYFRFTQAQLNELMQLLNVPEYFYFENNGKMYGEAAFLLYLRMNSVWIRQTDMELEFTGGSCGHYSYLSRGFTEFATWLEATHGWRLYDNLAFWIHNFRPWNQAIRRKFRSWYGVDMSQRCSNVAFTVDATVIGICEPKDPVIGGICYSHYEGFTGLKVQPAVAPNGQAFHIPRILPGASHNDNHVMVASELNSKIRDIQIGEEFQFVGYLDRAYAHHYSHMVSAYNNRGLPMADWQILDNQRMKTIAGLGEQKHYHSKQFFKLISTKHRMKIMERPIGLYILNAFLLDNIWVGYNGCAASRFYDCPPATPHEYLSWVNPN